MVAYTYNPSAQDRETVLLKVQSQLAIHSKTVKSGVKGGSKEERKEQ